MDLGSRGIVLSVSVAKKKALPQTASLFSQSKKPVFSQRGSFNGGWRCRCKVGNLFACEANIVLAFELDISENKLVKKYVFFLLLAL